MSVDLPEPDTPVKHTNLRKGMSTLIFLRLCSSAPLILINGVARSTLRRSDGTAIFISPRKYLPVRESFALPRMSHFVSSSRCDFPCLPDKIILSGPEKTTSPRCLPAPGQNQPAN